MPAEASQELHHLSDNRYDRETGKADGAVGIPYMLIIGKDGKIIRVYRGHDEASLPQIVADINAATGATPAP